MKKNREKNELMGGGLPLASANLPTASGSSATPSAQVGWPVSLLSDVADCVLGKMLDQNKNKGEYYPYLGNSDVRWGYFDFSSLSSMRFESDEHVRYGLEFGDLIICEGGEPGRCSVWKSQVPGMKFQKALHRVRSNRDILDYNYLFYWFLRAGQSKALEQFFTGTTIKHLTGQALKKLEIPLPPLPIQKRIASILGALDDKIALNRRINQTLEQIAQALFQSWFVDFDPVKAKQAVLEAGGTAKEVELAAMQAISGKSASELKAFQKSQPEQYAELEATAKLFPGKLVESELGLIPEGWEWKSFGVVSKCFDSKRIPLSKAEREKLPGIIPYYGATSVMDFVGKYLFDDKFLLLGEDGSVLKDDGTPFVQYIWGKSWVNNHAHVLQGADSISTEHLMVFIKSRNITPYVNGAVQMKLNQKNMNSIPFLFASEDLNITFSKLADALYSKFRILSDELKQLEKTRDSLLPKLLSGEIEVSNIALEYSK